MDDWIQYTLHNGIARLVLNRPDKRNALTRGMLEQLLAALRRPPDEGLRVLELSARGTVFCAGMDLGEMQQRAGDLDAAAQWHRDSEVYGEVLQSLYELPVPTVAAVQGPVLAGGLGLMLACDIVLATGEAFFVLPEPQRGITAAMVTPLLIHRVGAGRAAYVLLSGRRVTAPRALEFGLCHELTDAARFEAARDELLRSILSGSPAALAITKRHVGACSGRTVLDALRMSLGVSAQARETDDAREGLAAFLQKRPPRWQPPNPPTRQK